jgi:hypothetical protein
MLTLKRFRVTNFRSVIGSGWIETDSVTSLIGTNESGKTNLLLPLWKLNPAGGGEIDLLADAPRTKYNAMRRSGTGNVFIDAEFSVDDELAAKLAATTGQLAERFDRVRFSRSFNGTRVVHFPHADPPRSISTTVVIELLQSALRDMQAAKLPNAEKALFVPMAAVIKQALEELGAEKESLLTAAALAGVQGALATVATDAPSALVSRWERLAADLGVFAASLAKTHPDQDSAACALAEAALPVFVYYSNYGNLDSEIYLPHVLANMKRTDLGEKEKAKARTLRILFEYVDLQPQEILELGKAASVDAAKPPAPEAIEAAAKRTKERDVLLRSADSSMTKSFREWWKQGEYRFRFAADGEHFRIWVSDDLRPDDIELESRSTGLQWFLASFSCFSSKARRHTGAPFFCSTNPG